ncbi:hypothetical protein ABMA32_11090 [Mesorhizobium sp. VNQ89]|uniref:hypothetical protein n=1 Tax=Mesorhizobium quangtriensis TaxID=3157709 RepID=UPI0032B81FCC
MSIVAKTAVVIGLISLTSPAVYAADLIDGQAPVEAAPEQDRWAFSIAPYLWGAGLQGDVGLFGLQPVDVDMSFGDIFDNLRFGGMVVGEAHNGTWGILADIVYVKIELDETVERTVQNVGPVALAGNVQTSSFTGTLMGQYRVVAEPTATVDLMAGARIWSVNNDISLSLSAGGPPLAEFSGSDGATWVDPMVGIRGRVDLNPAWYLTGWGMVGGLGAGSDVSWDVLGAVGYQWTERTSIVGGYRALGVDYENDGFLYDVVQSGPVLGAVFRF